jgi:uncharacterized membrane protein YkvA (DUF1232 family)
MDTDNKPKGFAKDYSEESFWEKVLRYAKSAGRDVIKFALQLFYAAQAPETPVWAKAVIFGALGYFINILDAIPDLTPAVGYGDDLGVLVAAVATVAAYITPEIEQKVQEQLKRWFDEEEAEDGEV